jgi:murein DD-endopeptidase MepM/ murein hydrolase activator NlpD
LRKSKKTKIFSPATIVVTSILTVALVTCIVLLGSNFLTDKRIEAMNISHGLEIAEYKHKIEQYKDQYSEIIKIRDKYRMSLQEMVSLLYNKEAPVGVGGETSTVVGASDEVVLLEIRNTISTMKDDQKLFEQVKGYLNSRKNFIENFPFVWPIGKNGVPKISSGFGFREDLFGDGFVHFHEGIDIVGSEGDLVIATADGKVTATVYNDEKMGNIIVLSHQYGFTTAYAHLSKILVKAGTLVKRGSSIGKVGSTGQSQGPHVHYEIRKDKIPLDPMNFLGTNY